jgi:hypothetical protein
VGYYWKGGGGAARRAHRRRTHGKNRANIRPHQFGRKRGEPAGISFRRPRYDFNVGVVPPGGKNTLSKSLHSQVHRAAAAWKKYPDP